MIRALLALAAIVGAVLVLEWMDWPPAPPTAGLELAGETGVGTGIPAQPDPLAQLSPPEPRDTYASVTERPLFRPERKPPDPDTEEAEPEPEPEVASNLDGMDVSAVIITPAVVAAWVRDPKAAKLTHLRPGDELEGWSVMEIQSDRVVLERQGERDELLLRDFSKGPAAAPMPPPPVRSRQNAAPQRHRPPPSPPPARAQRPTGASGLIRPQ